MRTNLSNNNDIQSGIGDENSWAILQIGRGRESWGSGNDIQLALSENSGTYDYFLLASDYGNIRVRYIHGFLEILLLLMKMLLMVLVKMSVLLEI